MAYVKCDYHGSQPPAPITESFAGLTLQWERPRGLRHVGTLEQILALNIAPADLPIPGRGEFSKTRKAYFFDGDGRRYGLQHWRSKRGVVTFALEVYRFSNERKAYELAERNAAARAAREEVDLNAVQAAPDFEVERADRESRSARFTVGDVVLYDGELAEVVDGYDLYYVCLEDGPYVDANGKRIAIRPGYVVRQLGGKPFFVAPHELDTREGQLSHVRLVTSDGRQVVDACR